MAGTARHLDFRDDSYRGTYWSPPELPIQTTLSPTGKESLRQQRIKKASYTTSTSVLRAGSAGSAPELRSLRRINQDPLTRSLSESSGTIRSLPTQIADKPTTVNINHLRGGVRSFAPRTNIDNWVEERFDVNYPGSSTGPRFAKRVYQSTATVTLGEATSKWRERKAREQMVARVPKDSHDYRSIRGRRTNYINYDSRPTFYQTISQTTYQGRESHLEFQARNGKLRPTLPHLRVATAL
mmetsp:Transcript_15164/g.51888  ORF Transcript_15164/g.51888 Transcript_15164/m.51888 type:complete len:240 (+) Transcript_15164:72-791(+)